MLGEGVFVIFPGVVDVELKAELGDMVYGI
jgi:hypothetical protein